MMMTDPTRKEMLVDAIIGRAYSSISFSFILEKEKLAEYTGNGHVDNWSYRRDLLMKMGAPDLVELYKRKA